MKIHNAVSQCMNANTIASNRSFFSAFNYNFTDKTCTHITNPCALALNYPAVKYMAFPLTSANQCYEWVLYHTNNFIDERTTVTDRSEVRMSRMQRGGNDIVDYLHTKIESCSGWYGDRQIDRNSGPCQILMVKEGCTLFWVPYVVGQRLPSRPVIGGKMANGDANYVVKLDGLYNGYMRHSAGYFMRGTSYGIGTYAGQKLTATVMHMLVVL